MGVQIFRSVGELLTPISAGVDMKNSFLIQRTETTIYIDRPNDERIEVLIDTADLEKAKSFPNSWGATRVSGRKWIIKGTYHENKIKKNITLSRFLMGVGETIPVRFINGNQLDHRKINLTSGYNEIQITKGNNYTIINNEARIELRRRNGEAIYTVVDADDLTRILKKGTWFAEWHDDFDNYLVHNVSYENTCERKRRVKMTLHSFIMGANPKEPIKHLDGDTLNNRKCNLAVYSQTMLNDFIESDEGTVKIILRDKGGNEKGITFIDSADLDKVKSNGYTWFYFVGNGEPYAVSSIKRNRIYLHRLIVDAPQYMSVDHINHNTLDNRRANLMIATHSENQQNRKGSRKNSRSGIRGISWDNTHKQWIVAIKGKYYGRFAENDLDGATKLAKQVYNNVMPYLKRIEKNSS